MTAERKPRTPRFEQEQVEVSLLAIYLGLHMGGNAIARYRGELEAALIQAGQRADRLGFIGQALSGMPQAIVPFHRRTPDIHLAASLMGDLGRACFRTDGSAVDAGYFMWVGDEVRYIDESSDKNTRVPEVLDPFGTRSLLHDLTLWSRRPCVEVLDSSEGDLLRLIPGTDRFSCLKFTPTARKEPADKAQRATVSLLKVGPKPQLNGATSSRGWHWVRSRWCASPAACSCAKLRPSSSWKCMPHRWPDQAQGRPCSCTWTCSIPSFCRPCPTSCKPAPPPRAGGRPCVISLPVWAAPGA
ncbi:MAG: hypothetical protein LW719_15200 [Comamonadaceae bacterium]|nr:hypothetical protein [Comamonadaceae bacterium]